MAEHHLNRTEIRPIFKEMCGERMPEHMRRNTGPDTGLACVLHDLHPERLPRHRAAAIREKQMRIIAAVEVRPAALEVGGDVAAGAVAERNDALLRSLAERPQETGIEDEIFDFDANQLRDAKSGRVQQ